MQHISQINETMLCKNNKGLNHLPRPVKTILLNKWRLSSVTEFVSLCQNLVKIKS